MFKRFLLIVSVVAVASAAPLVIGTADPNDGNCDPFGCASSTSSGFPSTRYQQVYDAGQFAGPLNIAEMLFYAGAYTLDTNTLATGNWALYLSTTSKAVNGLDIVNFDANVTGPETLFATITSNGTVIPNTWIIPGTTFHYDPAKGNLLLDIKSNVTPGTGNLFLDAMNGDAGGVFSRAQNFTGGYDNYGLVTGFDVVPEPRTSTLLLAALGLLAISHRNSRRASASGVSR